jgi:hypothetical protein
MTQTHKPNHAIFISANMTPLKNRFVFHVHGLGTCRAARGRAVFRIYLPPSI